MTTRHEIVSIEHGPYRLELCPKGGGCITAFRYDAIDLLRPATDEYWQTYEPRAAGSFPLVPFSNRIADGRAVFEGETYQFPINMPPEPHSIHGDGWKAAWTVENAGPARAILVHAPSDTPFPYAAKQIFELSDEGLVASLEITNTGERRIPAGFGHHPYFPRTDDLTLEMALPEVWLPDERHLPVRKEPVPEAWDFSTPKRLAPLVELDHDFTGGEVRAVLQWPKAGIRLSIDTDPIFRHMVVFVPPGRDYVCVEPVSHVGNAVNLAADGRADTGIETLEPGETLEGAMTFRAAVGARRLSPIADRAR
ncbi:MAG: aldose 1-epimerase [Alphaproteobacteria bacterium]|nr:aldose 1-epimerase [Alphaproteobacteria bacterium]